MIFSQRHKDLFDQGTKLFEDRKGLLSLWQEIAENFYPERADFTSPRSVGTEFASHLDTSYPILARRDLGNAFGAMLRPPSKEWFHIRAKRREIEDEPARKWLEMVERTQRRAMYDRESGFVRSTKEGDHDFAAFGQCVISAELAESPVTGPILLHRCWHLRDVAWCEDSVNRITTIYREWMPTARELASYFPGKVHANVTKLLAKEPYTKVKIWHVVMVYNDYDLPKKRDMPFVSVYLDIENQWVLEETGILDQRYIIPRWQTAPGSQYAFSPATVAALPDARLMQAMWYTLLTAGEKAADPPLIGVQDALKGPIEAFPGGFTPVDAQYDERLGEVLRPLTLGGKDAIPLGIEMLRDVRGMIAEAFYLNRLIMPPPQDRTTAYEIAQRMEEFIRQALPLFEPMESDYNGALCELDFGILLRAGAFGPRQLMPETLSGEDVEFQFESPLREASDRIKAQKFIEGKGLLVEVAPLDPLAVQMIDPRKALRDALHGIGIPADWMRDEEQMAEIDAAAAQNRKSEALLQKVSQGAQVAEQIGNAGAALKTAAQPERVAA